jgi:hypothetical protein
MSTEAFGARRVRESLRAISTYLDSATHLAEGVPPGETVRLDLEPPGPRLRSLHEKNGTRKIKLPDSSGSGDDILLVGEGENLDKPKAFTLEKVARHVISISATAVTTAPDGESFVATFKAKDLLPGVYDARFENLDGQRSLLSRAVHVEAPHDHYKDGGQAAIPTRTRSRRPQAS